MTELNGVTVIVTEGDTEKMSVRLLFPTYFFSRNMLNPNLDEGQGYDLEYNNMLIEEVAQCVNVTL